MITKCKQTAENSCSLFYKQKNSNSTWLALWFRLSLSFFNLCHCFFNTRSKNEQCTENLHFCGQREKKISSKTKNMFIKAWDSLQKTIPPPLFTAMYSPVWEWFQFFNNKKKFLFSVLFILNKKGKTKKILANYCISLDDLIFWVNPVFLITFLNDNFWMYLT